MNPSNQFLGDFILNQVSHLDRISFSNVGNWGLDTTTCIRVPSFNLFVTEIIEFKNRGNPLIVFPYTQIS